LIEPGRPHLTTGAQAAGILVIIESLQATLKEVATGTPAAFALPEAPIVKAKSITEASLDF
jgi:hypothetical protein